MAIDRQQKQKRNCARKDLHYHALCNNFSLSAFFKFSKATITFSKNSENISAFKTYRGFVTWRLSSLNKHAQLLHKIGCCQVDLKVQEPYVILLDLCYEVRVMISQLTDIIHKIIDCVLKQRTCINVMFPYNFRDNYGGSEEQEITLF